MDAIDLGRISLGLVLLVGGGEALVRGATSIATKVGLSSLVVGLTVVAMATSAPELAVSVDAVFRGEPDLAIGNVVGSNIANVLLILGVAALILPLSVQLQLIRFDLPVMVGISGLLLLLSLSGRLGLVEGIILLAAGTAHMVFTVITSRRAEAAKQTDSAGNDQPQLGLPLAIGAVAFGVGLLVFGANQLVAGAVNIATALGVSSLVIGLTVVAIGTSLPELATSVVAAIRGERDLAVGNIVGSCIFNIAFVLGIPAVVAGLLPRMDGVPVAASAIAFDIPLMIATAAALVPVAFTGFVIARWEGGLFVALYAAYVLFVLLASTQHDALAGFTMVMGWFVLPLLAITLIALALFEKRRRAGASAG